MASPPDCESAPPNRPRTNRDIDSGSTIKSQFPNYRCEQMATKKARVFAGIVFIIVMAVSTTANAKNTAKSDLDRFNGMSIDAVDYNAASLIKCGEKSRLDASIESLTKLAKAYSDLHSEINWPKPYPEIAAERTRLSCDMYDCKVLSSKEECLKNIDYTDRLKQRIDKALNEAEKRLSGRKIAKSSASASADNCPNRAQSYQDSYRQGGRVEDLVCMKKALSRELR